MRKLLIILSAIVLFFVLTNPSMQKFKEYRTVVPGYEEKAMYRRTTNCILFSFFESKIVHYNANRELVEADKRTYLGIAMNFYRVNK